MILIMILNLILSGSGSEKHGSQKRSDSKEEYYESTSISYEEFKHVVQALMGEFMESDNVPPYIREEAKRLAHDISEKIAKHEVDLTDVPAIVFSAARALAQQEILYRIASSKQD